MTFLALLPLLPILIPGLGRRPTALFARLFLGLRDHYLAILGHRLPRPLALVLELPLAWLARLAEVLVPLAALPLGSRLRLLWLLRFPLFFCGLAWTMPFLALGSNMLGNLYALDAPFEVAAAGGMAFALAVAGLVSARTVLGLAELRFEIEPLDLPRDLRDLVASHGEIPVRSLLEFELFPAAFLSASTWVALALRAGLPVTAAALSLDLLVGLILLLLYGLLVEGGRPGWPVWINRATLRLRDGVHRLSLWLMHKFRARRGYIHRLGSSEGPELLLPGQQRAIASFSTWALVYFLLFYLYAPSRAAAGCRYFEWAGDFRAACLPTLAYLLLLITILAWALSGLAFYLDRVRCSPLLSLGTLVLIAFLINRNDHHYALYPAPEGQAGSRPEAQVDAWLDRVHPALRAGLSAESSEPPPLILVAAAGGGITAATWTARVLSGLEQELGGAFADNLLAISGVSGGSVGGAFYIADRAHRLDLVEPKSGTGEEAVAGSPARGASEASPAGIEADSDSTEDPSTAASRPPSRSTRQPEMNADDLLCAVADDSLRSMSWGLVYPDVLRLFLPFSGYFGMDDRGAIGELAWRSFAATDYHDSEPDKDSPAAIAPSAESTAADPGPRRCIADRYPEASQARPIITLRQLDAPANAGRLPTPLLNSMMIEEGWPLSFGPTRFADSARPGKAPACREVRPEGQAHLCGFFDQYPSYDVGLMTAARMSATFPYITPAARPRCEHCPEREGPRPAAGPGSQISELATDHSDFADPLPDRYLVDGGYFDNYGVVALTEWMDRALPRYRQRGGRRVLVLRVFGSNSQTAMPAGTCGAEPSSEPAAIAESGAASSDGRDSLGPAEVQLPRLGDESLDFGRELRAFLRSTVGPAQALASARGSTQNLRNAQTLELLLDREERDGLRFKIVDFELNTSTLPLSWKLTDCERQRVTGAWPAAWAAREAALRDFVLGPGEGG